MVCWCSPLTIIPVRESEVRFLHMERKGNIVLKESVLDTGAFEKRFGTPVQRGRLVDDQCTSMARPRSQEEA
jgi:hypothetical protein